MSLAAFAGGVVGPMRLHDHTFFSNEQMSDVALVELKWLFGYLIFFVVDWLAVLVKLFRDVAGVEFVSTHLGIKTKLGCLRYSFKLNS